MKFKSYIPVVLLGALSLASCQEDMETFDNKVYTTVTDPVTTVFVKNNTTEATAYVQAGMAKNEAAPVQVTFGVNPSKVADYNSIYSMNAELLPNQFYSIPNPVGVIPAGGNVTDQVAVEFSDLQSLDLSKVYVLPVSIVSAPFESLSNNTYYFVVRESALINVVADMKENAAMYSEGNQAAELSALTEMTCEGLFNFIQFPNLISTFMGIEGGVLLRFGDAGIPGNQLQFATPSGNVTDASWQVQTGKWTHVALTFSSVTGEVNVYIDGVKKATQVSGYRNLVNWNTASGDITDGPRGFYIGYSYDGNRYIDGSISEMRIWNRCLTQEEIQAPYHFYYVEPDSPGLVAYWKFDEGAGKDIKDYANGYNLTCLTAPEWLQVSLPVKN